MKSILAFLTFLAIGSATAINLEQSKEDRTFPTLISSGGSTYLSLNKTVVDYSVIALGVAAIAGAVIYSGALPLAAQNIQRKSQEFAEEFFVDTEGADQQTRYKRFAHNGNSFFY